ncbi:2-hydroxymuconate tautomerase [Hyphococcus sp.]|uniref:2-hydroxymuconate tautomerase n=1 Tax=Hyphococcus sp. TaxID=2038636 RepID=UPI0035C7843C
MPIIEVHLMQGRSNEQKRAMCREVTKAVVETLGVDKDQVRILIHHLTPEHFSVGGVTWSESAQQSDVKNKGD